MNNVQDDSTYPKYCFAIRHHKVDCVPCNQVECFRAELLQAEKSAFFPDQLAEATNAINEILAGLQPESPDQSLAFIQTGMGIMLTWVTPNHDAGFVKDESAITSEDGPAAVAEALKLRIPNR